mmetsp:Transcript_6752/g.16521  ORF Transcript_6752/g.16521 Transcript_6752/m.16521 type:complete len:211 (+) Transcript_6752:2199-2831(+)
MLCIRTPVSVSRSSSLSSISSTSTGAADCTRAAHSAQNARWWQPGGPRQTVTLGRSAFLIKDAVCSFSARKSSEEDTRGISAGHFTTFASPASMSVICSPKQSLSSFSACSCVSPAAIPSSTPSGREYSSTTALLSHSTRFSRNACCIFVRGKSVNRNPVYPASCCFFTSAITSGHTTLGGRSSLRSASACRTCSTSTPMPAGLARTNRS